MTDEQIDLLWIIILGGYLVVDSTPRWIGDMVDAAIASLLGGA